MSMSLSDDSGFSALWVALVALFLVAAAALAVDTSGAFNTAQTDQTTADLACLAGVNELPDDPTAGIDLAIRYAVDNWPEMAGHSTTISGMTGTYADGTGNEIFVDGAYGGDDSKMHIRITEVTGTYFAGALGRDSVRVSQEAWCRVSERSSGTGVPFAAPLGGFTGGVFGPNPCGTSSGNCGSLSIPRDDATGAGDTLIKNIARGPDRLLDDWLGNVSGSSACRSVSAGDTCHRTDTDTGVSAAHIGEGFLQRFENDPGATCTTAVNGRTINCDTKEDVLGSDPIEDLMTAFPSQPSFWEPSLHGTYNGANTANHFYFEGVIAKCDSPRLGRMPIITENLNWDLGGAPTGWPHGKKEVKFVGFYWIIIVNPNDSSDWQGSGNAKKADAVIIWWGPNVECQGSPGKTYPFDPDNPITSRDVFLVDDTN
jgi:hypothetical protein